MFSVREKRNIAECVQAILRATNHPELPEGEISFTLHVDGAESWSWADIKNNGAVDNPGVNPWNEAQDPVKRTIPEEQLGSLVAIPPNVLRNMDISVLPPAALSGNEKRRFVSGVEDTTGWEPLSDKVEWNPAYVKYRNEEWQAPKCPVCGVNVLRPNCLQEDPDCPRHRLADDWRKTHPRPAWAWRDK